MSDDILVMVDTLHDDISRRDSSKSCNNRRPRKKHRAQNLTFRRCVAESDGWQGKLKIDGEIAAFRSSVSHERPPLIWCVLRYPLPMHSSA